MSTGTRVIFCRTETLLFFRAPRMAYIKPLVQAFDTKMYFYHIYQKVPKILQFIVRISVYLSRRHPTKHATFLFMSLGTQRWKKDELCLLLNCWRWHFISSWQSALISGNSSSKLNYFIESPCWVTLISWDAGFFLLVYLSDRC